MQNMFPGIKFKVVGEPVDLAGAKALADQKDRYQFQWWALSVIQARPYGNDRKKGKDTGIDGILYFQDEPDKIKRAIIQVKSGNVGVKDIRDLAHVIDREKAEIGIFITLEPPTKDMEKEAVIKGFYESPSGRKYSRIRIKTIEELLDNPHLDIDIYRPAMFKQAGRVDLAKDKNLELEFSDTGD